MAEVDTGLLEPCPSWARKVYIVFLGLDVVHDLWDDRSWCHVCGAACAVIYNYFVIVRSGIVYFEAREMM